MNSRHRDLILNLALNDSQRVLTLPTPVASLGSPTLLMRLAGGGGGHRARIREKLQTCRKGKD